MTHPHPAALDDPRPADLLELVAERLDPTPRDVFDLLGYRPTDVQAELHALAPASDGGPFDVLYGGAAGGGKTKALLLDALDKADRFPGLRVYLFRRTYPELEDSLLEELANIGYAAALGARYNITTRILRLPNGSSLRFRYANNLKDAAHYLSAEMHYLIVDERTTLDPEVIAKLRSRVRSGDPAVPVIGLRSGTNPGGPGHSTVKAEHVDPAPLGRELIEPSEDELAEQATAELELADERAATGDRAAADRALDLREALAARADGDARAMLLELLEHTLTRYFIPAKVTDNPHIDPGYVARLNALPPAMRAAYRDGSWDAFEGQRFATFTRRLHVRRPADLDVPKRARRAIGIDYGLEAPFVALWGALLPDDLLVVYRELSATGLSPREQAEAVLAAEHPRERIAGYAPDAYLDPSTWARDPNDPRPATNPRRPPRGSIAGRYVDAGLPVSKANNDRRTGAAAIDDRLRVRDDGLPRLIILDTCVDLIRTLPTAPRSTKDPEDVDDKWPDDHWYDALRYLVLGFGFADPAALEERRRPRSSRPVRAVSAGMRDRGF